MPSRSGGCGWIARSRRTRAGFAGTAGVGPLDNISVYENLEDESRAWAARTGGSVLELHAYALPAGTDEAALKQQLLGGLHALYPETAGASIVEERFLLRQDCPAFAPGSHPLRPEVRTPFRGLSLAGDFVQLPFPTALMERAASAGMLAASTLLDALGVAAGAAVVGGGSRATRARGRAGMSELILFGRPLPPSTGRVDPAGLAAGRPALDGHCLADGPGPLRWWLVRGR